MTLAIPIPITSPTRAKDPRRLAWFGAAWAASYIPVHVYWAVGGKISWIGVTSDPDFRTANWGASIVIAGAALVALSLGQPWGERLPGTLRRGIAWLGGGVALAHWALFTAASGLRMTGLVNYRPTAHASTTQLRHFDWLNVSYFELWFGVMGVVLIAIARRHRARAAKAEILLPTRRRAGVALTVAGIGVIVFGVIMFAPWIFAAAGPALMGAGLLTLVAPETAAKVDR
jgi:hypothetical protein